MFVHHPGFVADWYEMGLDDDDLRLVEVMLMTGPTANPVMPGTGGLRKLRFSSSKWKHGKSGGARVLYAHFPEQSVLYLIAAYPKSQQDNITKAEKNGIKALLKSIQAKLEEGSYA
ncbi:MAG: type II toxin-antitoxin system RelE/ParE family toxin [Planctomycetota bacterium]